MGLAGARLADQQDRLGAGDVIALRQRAQLARRDAGSLEFEPVERLHPRQPGLLQQARDRSGLTLLHLGAEQRLEVADMGLSLARGGLRQPRELAADHRGADWIRAAIQHPHLVSATARQ
jgi:hypothetical protein